jgi:hypothetical protein
MVNSIQCWHSDSPLESKYLHAHVNGLNLFYDKGADSFYVVDSFINLDEKRAVWFDCVKWLAKKYGVDLSDVDDVNFYHQFVPIKNDFLRDFDGNIITDKWGEPLHCYRVILHDLKYNFRKAVVDIVKYVNHISKVGIVLTDAEKLRMKELLDGGEKGHKEKVWIGWLGDGVKNKYLHKLGVHVKTKKEIIEELKDEDDGYYCPICGEEMCLTSGDGGVWLKDLPDNAIILSEMNKKRSVRRVVRWVSGKAYHEQKTMG